MKLTRICTFFAGLAVICSAATSHADIGWDAGAPGGTGGTSLNFDGDINTGTGTWLDTGVPASALTDYTISLWLRSNGANSNDWFVGHETQGIHLGVFTPNANNDPATERGLRHAHWGADSSGNTTIAADTWVHATFTYDADGGSFQTDTDGDGVNDADPTGLAETFVNGVSDSGPVANPGTPVDKRAPNDISGNIVIGSRDVGTRTNGTGRDHWVGNLDDVAIWDSVLPSSDIALIAGGTDPTTLGVGAYWSFEDDTTGSVASVQGTGLGGDLTGVTAIPEPSSMAIMLGLGLGAMGMVRRKRS